MPSRLFIVVTLILPLFQFSCVDGQDAARVRAAREYDCPEDKIEMKYLGESQLGELWQVHACGVVATYACKSTSSEGQCIRESDDRKDANK